VYVLQHLFVGVRPQAPLHTVLIDVQPASETKDDVHVAQKEAVVSIACEDVFVVEKSMSCPMVPEELLVVQTILPVHAASQARMAL
jgi:hypothetical protein